MHSSIPVRPDSPTARHRRAGFTLIELLLVIAIIAVLALVVLLVINPAELLKQTRDSNRLSDLGTLNSALNVAATDILAQSAWGNASTTYLSIIDPTATSTAGTDCTGVGLVAPAGLFNHCAASSTVKKIDGTGWLPVDLRQVSAGVPLDALPIDPTNTTSSNFYYTYQPDTTPGKYKLTAFLESQKYVSKMASDGGIDAITYEVGNSLALPSTGRGMVDYWTFDEGSGGVAADSSGNGNSGTWGGTQSGTSGYYSVGKVGPYAGTFNGTNDTVISTVPQVSSVANAATSVSFWMKWNGAVGTVVFNIGQFNYYLSTSSCSGINNSASIWGTSVPPSNQWVLMTFVLYNGSFNNNGSAIYVNGAPVSLSGCNGGSYSATSNPTFILGAFRPGTLFFYNGFIDDLRIYSRALSAAEIQRLYDNTK